MSSPTPSLRHLLALVLLVFAGTAVTVNAYIDSRRPDAFGVVQWRPAAVRIELQPECDDAEVRDCPEKCAAPVPAKPAACRAS
ncbi:MAG: hypothetical protein E2O39_05930 [Planctomycetota bacterium]|nr:MAG: hypothetical protein E2O39_05930 [Planctomycetota bacterium]